MISKPRLLVIALLLTVVGAGGLVLGMQQTRMQAMDGAMRALKEALARAQGEAESLKAQLAEHAAARRLLADQLSAVQRAADQAQQTITTLQQQQADAQARYATLQKDKESLAAQLTGAIQERDEARRHMTALQTEQRTLDSRYRALEQRYASLAQGAPPSAPRSVPSERPAASGGKSGAIELPPIIVHHPAPPSAPAATPSFVPASVPARIVEINERYHFVVIDQGSAEGVEPDQVFDIIRDSLIIGSVTVRQVREHLAACDVAPAEEASMPLRIGDAAVLRGD